MTTQEGNKLIAEFMGFKKTIENRYEEWVASYPDTKRVLCEYFVAKETPLTKKRENKLLLFHTSWDWLMPVVEKIEAIIFKVNITTNCIIFRVSLDDSNDIVVEYKKNNHPKIKAVWEAVTQFITWYNTNNPKTPPHAK